MNPGAENTTVDGFLDGRLRILQPQVGYRAATDPVYLAAAVSARSGQSALELGCGVGVASLCLGWRVPGTVLHAVELQASYAELARENALQNRIDLAVATADITNLPASIRMQSFDHVFTNPPFFAGGQTTAPHNAGKGAAHLESLDLRHWIAVGLKRLKPGGVFTLIHLSDRLPEILAALAGPAGDIRIKPIAPRTGKPAKRVIVRARKAARGPAQLLAPLVVHQGDAHQRDSDSFSDAARRILRTGAAIDL
jgi:tRNA1(Val) A37 N6-methylase TrmN6